MAKWCLEPIAPTQSPSPNKVPFGLGLGLGAGGWVLLGVDGVKFLLGWGWGLGAGGWGLGAGGWGLWASQFPALNG